MNTTPEKEREEKRMGNNMTKLKTKEGNRRKAVREEAFTTVSLFDFMQDEFDMFIQDLFYEDFNFEVELVGVNDDYDMLFTSNEGIEYHVNDYIQISVLSSEGLGVSISSEIMEGNYTGRILVDEDIADYFDDKYNSNFSTNIVFEAVSKEDFVSILNTDLDAVGIARNYDPYLDYLLAVNDVDYNEYQFDMWSSGIYYPDEEFGSIMTKLIDDIYMNSVLKEIEPVIRLNVALDVLKTSNLAMFNLLTSEEKIKIDVPYHEDTIMYARRRGFDLPLTIGTIHFELSGLADLFDYNIVTYDEATGGGLYLDAGIVTSGTENSITTYNLEFTDLVERIDYAIIGNKANMVKDILEISSYKVIVHKIYRDMLSDILEESTLDNFMYVDDGYEYFKALGKGNYELAIMPYDEYLVNQYTTTYNPYLQSVSSFNNVVKGIAVTSNITEKAAIIEIFNIMSSIYDLKDAESDLSVYLSEYDTIINLSYPTSKYAALAVLIGIIGVLIAVRYIDYSKRMVISNRDVDHIGNVKGTYALLLVKDEVKSLQLYANEAYLKLFDVTIGEEKKVYGSTWYSVDKSEFLNTLVDKKDQEKVLEAYANSDFVSSMDFLVRQVTNDGERVIRLKFSPISDPSILLYSVGIDETDMQYYYSELERLADRDPLVNSFNSSLFLRKYPSLKDAVGKRIINVCFKDLQSVVTTYPNRIVELMLVDLSKELMMFESEVYSFHSNQFYIVTDNKDVDVRIEQYMNNERHLRGTNIELPNYYVRVVAIDIDKFTSTLSINSLFEMLTSKMNTLDILDVSYYKVEQSDLQETVDVLRIENIINQAYHDDKIKFNATEIFNSNIIVPSAYFIQFDIDGIDNKDLRMFRKSSYTNIVHKIDVVRLIEAIRLSSLMSLKEQHFLVDLSESTYRRINIELLEERVRSSEADVSRIVLMFDERCLSSLDVIEKLHKLKDIGFRLGIHNFIAANNSFSILDELDISVITTVIDSTTKMSEERIKINETIEELFVKIKIPLVKLFLDNTVDEKVFYGNINEYISTKKFK